MLVGTLGSFAVMVLASQNTKDQLAQQNKLLEEYKKQMEEKKKEAKKLSATYYPKLKPYKDNPAAFDADKVGDKVTTKDLVVGDGAEINGDVTYQAYYIGWNPKGVMFDSSFDGDSLKAPIDTSTTTLIPGWQQGVKGMKVGGVREITIPSDLAYGETGQGEDIPPNTPIKFIVMVISAN
jgi:FKBP-type peptidyl-prolyl cis-trans isomerase